MSERRDSHIPFNRPHVTGRELDAIAEAIGRAQLSADGHFSELCRRSLEQSLACPMALVVHSCTAALELAALLLDVGPGDEVIMPSYTFVTTATAFAVRGATPVFVDVRPDTMNLDETLVEAALTTRTRAIVPVHYAGVAAEMDAIVALADTHSVAVVEDAAQGLCAEYRGRPLGTIGSLATISFHETKNVTCGHGGAIVVNDERLCERAEILRDKGTDRSGFVRGQIDKYTWQDLGSAYAISELAAAFLWPQLQDSESITATRRELWERYHGAFAGPEAAGLLRRPVVPAACHHNAHMYYLLMPDRTARDHMIDELARAGVNAVFHYVPLHSSPAGRRLGRAHGELAVTDDISGRLLRLPLWADMQGAHVERVVDCVIDALPRASRGSRGRRSATAVIDRAAPVNG